MTRHLLALHLILPMACQEGPLLEPLETDVVELCDCGPQPKNILLDPRHESFQKPAPDISVVHLSTNKGDIVIELYRSWSPNGVDRFFNLVRHGYYNGARFFRVRDGEFAQFGINGVPEIAKAWKNQRISDDLVRSSNVRGTVAFAMGYDTNDRTTQIYINLDDNIKLDEQGFSPIGKVIQGIKTADELHSGYGELAGGGIRGAKQEAMFNGGNPYFQEHFPELDYIIEAEILEERESF